jgi:hypothetical protein
MGVHAALAADGPGVSIALSATQRAELVKLTCSVVAAPDEMEIHAWQVPTADGKGIGAVVLCPQQGAVRSIAQFRQSHCAREPRKAWVCQDTLDAFHLPIGGQKVLITYKSPAMTFETAEEVSTLVGLKYGYTFNGRDLRAMMLRNGQCHVDRRGASVIKGALNYSLTCGASGVVVTRDCTRQPCRVFPSGVYDNGI